MIARPLRSRHSLLAVLAVAWVAAWAVAGVRAQGAKAPGASAAALAGPGGTRWSTVERAERAADLPARASAAGAELVWGPGRPDERGRSPLLFADAGLALPAAGAARVLVVDLVGLYDDDPEARRESARLQAAATKLKAEIEARQRAAGDRAAAAKAASAHNQAAPDELSLLVKKEEELDQEWAALEARVGQRLADEAVAAARARGATLVFDGSGFGHFGSSCIVLADTPLLLAAGGGRAPVAHVRTLDLDELYYEDPRMIEHRAKHEAERKAAGRERQRLDEARAGLQAGYERLLRDGDKPALAKAAAQLRALEDEWDAYGKNLAAARRERWRAVDEAIRADIARIAGGAARRAGANLVLDSSLRSYASFSYIAHAASALDLTAEVAREMKREAAPATAAAGGVRWSTVDLMARYRLDPRGAAGAAGTEDAALRELVEETRASLRARAAEVGADLVWDVSGRSSIGISPVVLADPALALPANAEARVLTVDLGALYSGHPGRSTVEAQIQARSREMEVKHDRTSRELAALAAEYRKVQASGDEAAEIRKWRETMAAQAEAKAMFERDAGELAKQRAAAQTEVLKTIGADVARKAAEQGATFVLDITGAMREGFSTVVHMAEPLRPAADGGVRAGRPPVAVVRTVDFGRLYEAHPRTIEHAARLQADMRKRDEELARLEELAAESARERDQRTARGDRAGAERKATQAQANQVEAEAFRTKALAELETRDAEHRAGMLARLTSAAGKVAERAGANLLLETSATSHHGGVLITYAAPRLDLTEEVAKELGIALVR